MSRVHEYFHRLPFVLFLMLACVLTVLCSNQSSYALDLFPDASLVYGDFSSQFYVTYLDNTNCSNSTPTDTWIYNIECTSGSVFINKVSLSIPNRTYNDGDWIVFELSTIGGGATTSNHFRFLGMSYTGTNPVDLISTELDTSNTNSGILRLYVRVHGTFTGSALDFSGINGRSLFEVIGPNGTLRLNPTSVWHERFAADNSNTINSINNSLNSTNSKLDSLRSAQVQANDDANDRYQDEKDTITDSTNDAQDNMDNIQRDTAFSLINPFSVFFNNFRDSCSFEMSRSLRSWLSGGQADSINPTYTSWWCVTERAQSVRLAVTSVLSFISVILTFKFIWRWLSTNEGEN